MAEVKWTKDKEVSGTRYGDDRRQARSEDDVQPGDRATEWLGWVDADDWLNGAT